MTEYLQFLNSQFLNLPADTRHLKPTSIDGNQHRAGNHQQGAGCPQGNVFLLKNDAAVDEPQNHTKALNRYLSRVDLAEPTSECYK